MTEPARLDRRCDQCAHVDITPGCRPMRCQHDKLLGHTLPVAEVRGPWGICGIGAALWAPRREQHADI